MARAGDGWTPFPAPAVLARTAKTPVLESIDDLVPMLDHLWRCVDEEGRDRASIDVSMAALGCASPGSDGFDAEQHLDVLGTLAEVGVTWTSTGLPGDSLAHALEALEQYATGVIAPQRHA